MEGTMMDYKELVDALRGIYPLNDYGFEQTMHGNIRGFQDMCGEAADAIEALTAENIRLRAELDAAVEDIPHNCRNCKNSTGEFTLCDKGKSLTKVYLQCPFWKWRGAKGENDA